MARPNQAAYTTVATGTEVSVFSLWILICLKVRLSSVTVEKPHVDTLDNPTVKRSSIGWPKLCTYFLEQPKKVQFIKLLTIHLRHWQMYSPFFSFFLIIFCIHGTRSVLEFSDEFCLSLVRGTVHVGATFRACSRVFCHFWFGQGKLKLRMCSLGALHRHQGNTVSLPHLWISETWKAR